MSGDITVEPTGERDPLAAHGATAEKEGPVVLVEVVEHTQVSHEGVVYGELEQVRVPAHVAAEWERDGWVTRVGLSPKVSVQQQVQTKPATSVEVKK